MFFRLLCCMALFSWGAGSLDPNVTQTPGYLVKGKGQKAKMECVPIKGHSYVFWYHRKLEEEFKFLVYLQDKDIVDKIEGFDNQFSAECPKNSPCTLEINSTEPGDSALYMCASNKATVLNVRLS
uniref:Ig-like domain-containing protein n=1 Tax=Mustela putorius furo TaxID=9669 RepID=M3YAW6_MUSPF